MEPHESSQTRSGCFRPFYLLGRRDGAMTMATCGWCNGKGWCWVGAHTGEAERMACDLCGGTGETQVNWGACAGAGALACSTLLVLLGLFALIA